MTFGMLRDVPTGLRGLARTVVKMLGHSQIWLTMSTYAHVLLEIERAAVGAATEHLFG